MILFIIRDLEKSHFFFLDYSVNLLFYPFLQNLNFSKFHGFYRPSILVVYCLVGHDVMSDPAPVLGHFRPILGEPIKRARLGLGMRVPFGWKHSRALFLEEDKLR